MEQVSILQTLSRRMGRDMRLRGLRDLRLPLHDALGNADSVIGMTVGAVGVRSAKEDNNVRLCLHVVRVALYSSVHANTNATTTTPGVVLKKFKQALQ